MIGCIALSEGDKGDDHGDGEHRNHGEEEAHPLPRVLQARQPGAPPEARYAATPTPPVPPPIGGKLSTHGSSVALVAVDR